jgi:aspyridone synthetase trans-acting enoyl reductase
MREALISSVAGKLELAKDVEIPLLGLGTMLCRVAAVGLNPADAKSSDHATSPGSIGGFDFAGEILHIGEGVTRFKPGDRVAGFAHGYNADDKTSGAFTSLVLAMEDMTLRIPDEWTYEQGATLGVVVATAGYALNHFLDIPLPDRGTKRAGKKNGYILISGGATGTGIIATQLLCLAGFKPVATCSPRSMGMVRSLGAVATFDYNLPNCGIEIRSFTGDTLTRALDCVTTSQTMSMCYEAISSKGGRYISLDPYSTHVKYKRRDVSADSVMAMSMTGNRVHLPGVYGRPAMPALRGLASRVFCMAEELMSEGVLRGPPFQIRSGGLASVGKGIEDLRKGLAKGEKLVYSLG